MRIDVIFDTVCPWCFIGKRRLEIALARRPGVRARLRWRPFLLNPDMPEGGIPRSAYLERKFGGTARVARMLSSLQDAGAGLGIDFDFNAITRTPNTLESHRLVRLATEQDKEAQVVEALFIAYFQQGRDIGDRTVLTEIAEACGMDGGQVEAHLRTSSGRGDVFMENAHTHRMSINGVPCFIFDGAYGIAGAQEPDILVRMIDMASEGRLEEPLSSPPSPLSARSDQSAGRSE